MADPGLLQRLSAAPRCRVDIHRPAAPTLLFPNKILIRVGLPYDPAEGTVNTGNKMCSNAAFNKIFYTWHTTHQATPELSHIFEKLASWIIDKNPKLVIWNKQYFIDIMKHLNLNLNLNRNLNLKSYFPVDQGCPHLVEILITAFQHYWHFFRSNLSSNLFLIKPIWSKKVYSSFVVQFSGSNSLTLGIPARLHVCAHVH